VSYEQGIERAARRYWTNATGDPWESMSDAERDHAFDSARDIVEAFLSEQPTMTRKEFFIEVLGLHENDYVQGQTRLNDKPVTAPLPAVVFWADDEWWGQPMPVRIVERETP